MTHPPLDARPSRPKLSPLNGSLIISKVGRDLTWLAQEGAISGGVGRDKEVAQMMQMLTRGRTRSMLLIGPAGVGKTALVEELAFRIARGEVSGNLGGKRIIESSFGNMWAHVGTSDNWGGYLKTLQSVVQECQQQGAILFMDEFQMIWGHSYSMAYIRPVLARGALTIIGATTDHEYLTFIEQDRATTRRFQIIRVEETDQATTVAILESKMQKFGVDHSCSARRQDLEYLVSLSNAYIPHLNQPSKAIGILEHAALAKSAEEPGACITRGDIRRSVCEEAGIPEEVLTAPRQRLEAMEAILNARVLGQEEAVARVCRRLVISKAGMSVTPERPDGVFLFAGPTGVGKTELAKALAAYLTGDEKNLVRLDMSTYSSASSIFSLIGFPGEQSTERVQHVPLLTRQLRARPYTVLLLDEMEKAHKEIWLLFLQAFDTGKMCDSLGNEIYLRNTVVIMTCNVGFSQGKAPRKAVIPVPGEARPEVRDDIDESAMVAIAATFPSEFLGRVDDIILFKPLTDKIMRRFVEQKISALNRITEKQIEATPSAIALICERGFSTTYGARDLNRAVDNLLGYPLARLRLSEDWERVKNIRVDRKGKGHELLARVTEKEGAR